MLRDISVRPADASRTEYPGGNGVQVKEGGRVPQKYESRYNGF